MTAPYTGGCQCGQIRYEIKAEPLTLYACHCKECQKQSSSAFGMSMPVPRDAVVILRGQAKQRLSLRWYFEMRVLITGFEPNDDDLNASELVVVSLRDRLL